MDADMQKAVDRVMAEYARLIENELHLDTDDSVKYQIAEALEDGDLLAAAALGIELVRRDNHNL